MNIKYELVAGGYYTLVDGDSKLTMFVESKDEEEGVFSAIVANDGDLYEREYAIGLFETNMRLATFDEREEFIALNPYQETWLEAVVNELVPKHWGVDDRPSIMLDPIEHMPTAFFGAYDAPSRSLVFHSGMLALRSEEEIRTTVLHELCHWYLHITGEAYRDEDVRFAQEIIRVGVEETINYHREDARQAYEEAKRNS
ncbi:M48 family metalloprotease (plasmid) [Paenibacillus thiaminolyticus]|uniref:SprT-like domain-containing protein n=1 Tax=Paenibacillus thiaminolyticus TaxID=49283 RepID=UPI00232B1F36|nr:SprT-like domain-containing protein [Paenibacillus thiaminolyticus]WCF11597.1 M48 family metalloprotease [Paenibacillus thiaminolyticus]